MIKKPLNLSVLLLGLIAGTAHSQVYIPLVFTNTLASSSGSSSLLGVTLGQNTTAQGIITFEIDSQLSQIQLSLSDGITSLNEDGSGCSLSLSQDLGNSTLTLSSVSSTPWGGLFQDVVYLPSSVMRSDAQTTLLAVLGGGKFSGPGISYDQYQSVVTISDGIATAIFNPAPTPEPSTFALSAIGGLVGIFYLRRRL